MVADEKYEFKGATKTKLVGLAFVGVVLFALGVFMAMRSGHEEHEPAVKASAEVAKTLVATNEPAAASEAHAEGEHHETAPWIKRIFASLWMNNVFFTGIGIIGLFFIAIQYAAQAGWSTPIRRIPLAIGHWIPYAGILMLVSWFIVKHDVFHWTHADLYRPVAEGGDKIIQGKSGLWYWPMASGTFPMFYIARMVIFFGLWYLFFVWIRKEILTQDEDGSTEHWYNARKFSAIFLVIFAVSSSMAAWDWVMSIDPHWYSTMNGWYVFASWWVTGLAAITLIVINLKDAGYLKMVNSNHLHDLGKFCFAFSIFWTYIWFSQFLLIYYANIPEETIYFVERLKNPPYSWIFYANLFLNFVFPFLLLMTRDAKRQSSMLKVVCPIIIVGHWFDFYNMVTPGVMQDQGGVGFLEIGMTLIFAAGFLFVVLSSLAKAPLVAKHDPLMEESLHHHI
jgi:hypothetical protein